jgi:hypothetical protein
LSPCAALAKPPNAASRYTPRTTTSARSPQSAELGGLLNKLERNPLLFDVAIWKAGEFISSIRRVRYRGFREGTLTVLDNGIARAKELGIGSPS